MRKISHLAIISIIMTLYTMAAERVDLRQANLGNNGNNFANELNSLLNLGSNGGLNLLHETFDADGTRNTRYQQTFKGVPIWGYHVIVSTKTDNSIASMHGESVTGITQTLGTVPALSAQDAMRNMKPESSKGLIFSNEESLLVIYLDGSVATLAYSVNFFQDKLEGGEPSRPHFIVDALSGEVLKSWEGLTTSSVGTGPGGNNKTGQYSYGTSKPYLDVAVSGSTYTMENANVKTVDLQHGTSGSTAYSYTGPNNSHEAINGAFCPLNDAHHFGNVIYDMYSNWYGTVPLTFQLVMKVHYSNTYEGAFWNGSDMTFGDGASTFYPLVGLDVAAHEVSHGFTQQNSNLVYTGMAAGINEAFSDMAGEAAENYENGSNDWEVGVEVFKVAGALRYMHNPPLDGSSIDHATNYYAGLSAHYAAGLFNKACYLLATTAGWTTKKAFECFVRANQNYWTPTPSFDQAGQSVVDAAIALGYNSVDVVSAFAQVGVNTTLLTAGVAVNGLAAATGNWTSFYIDVPAGQSNLDVNLSGGTGDADLYVRFGSPPTASVYACQSWNVGNIESCSFANPAAGRWYISLHAYSTYSGASLVANTCTLNSSATGLSGTTGFTYYNQPVPACATSLTVAISGGTGDCDLYLNFATNPTLTTYLCRPYLNGNNESCTIAGPSTGTYYIGLNAYTAYSGLTMTTSYQ